MKHNNALPNNHFKKTAIRFKTWFDQPAKKEKRAQLRKEKAERMYPMPVEKLRPLVRCSTIRYNIKQKLGRGFTPEECRAAGLDYNYARTIGISVDMRRKNMNKETFDENVERIKVYTSRLTFYKDKKEAKRSGVAQHTDKIMPLKKTLPVVQTIKVEEIAQKFPPK